MKCNFHTHTYYCGHASGTAEEYIKEAIKKNFDILGFSEHSYIPIDCLSKERMTYETQEKFLNEVLELKEKYKDKIKIYVGLELDYFLGIDEYYEKIKKQFDYFGLAVHFYESDNPIDYSSFAISNLDQAKKYRDLLISGIRSGLYKFICHPDIFMYSMKNFDKEIEVIMEEIIKEAMKNNLAMELNMNAFRRPFVITDNGPEQKYTRNKYLELLEKYQVPVIVSSDCHNIELLDDEYFEYGFKLVEMYNLNLIDDVTKL